MCVGFVSKLDTGDSCYRLEGVTPVGFCVNLLMKFPTRHPNLNSLWSALLLEELWRLGVEHICIAPGSRSAPLTLAAAVHPSLQQHVHFDERGLAFYALGLAKSSGKPVAVITTSGTAVPNLYPAIVEARQSGVPLVIITADRPPELIDCGANQAIEQQDIFSGYPGATIRLPTPSLDIPANWLLTSIDQAYARSCRQGLPLHINCMFREPLYPGKKDEDYSLYLAETTRWIESGSPHTEYELQGDGSLNASPVSWAEFMSGKGLVVVGRLRTSDDINAVLALAQRLSWPVLADIQSQLHGHPAVIPHSDLFLASRSGRALMCQADRVFQVGGHLISKRLDHFLAAIAGSIITCWGVKSGAWIPVIVRLIVWWAILAESAISWRSCTLRQKHRCSQNGLMLFRHRGNVLPVSYD